MKIDGVGTQPRHERVPFKKRVQVTTDAGARFEAVSHDVSLSGISLSLNAPLMENGQFLELHAEGLGNMAGKVARTYDGGAAVQFEKLLQESPTGTDAPGSVDKTA